MSLTFVLESMYNNDDLLKYPKVFQYHSGFKFESDGTKLLEKQNGDVSRAMTKYKYTCIAFVESPNKELAKQLVKRIYPQ